MKFDLSDPSRGKYRRSGHLNGTGLDIGARLGPGHRFTAIASRLFCLDRLRPCVETDGRCSVDVYDVSAGGGGSGTRRRASTPSAPTRVVVGEPWMWPIDVGSCRVFGRPLVYVLHFRRTDSTVWVETIRPHTGCRFDLFRVDDGVRSFDVTHWGRVVAVTRDATQPAVVCVYEHWGELRQRAAPRYPYFNSDFVVASYDATEPQLDRLIGAFRSAPYFRDLWGARTVVPYRTQDVDLLDRHRIRSVVSDRHGCRIVLFNVDAAAESGRRCEERIVVVVLDSTLTQFRQFSFSSSSRMSGRACVDEERGLLIVGFTDGDVKAFQIYR